MARVEPNHNAAREKRRSIIRGFGDNEIQHAVNRAALKTRSHTLRFESIISTHGTASAGAEAYLMDDNMVRMDWFYSNLIGGIKLKVQPGDVDAANEILSQPMPEAIEVEGMDYEQPKCPQCQSLDISYRQLNTLVSYGSLYL